MNIVFAGALGRFPVGGHAWAELNYILGFQALGHTVYFLEDCGIESWVYNWETEQITTELDYPVQYVRDCLGPLGLGDRWIYRAGDQSAGMPPDKFREVCANADLFLVRSLSLPVWREEYNWPARRIFIDTDPGFTQIRVDNGDNELASTIGYCERLFTIGQRIGSGDCQIPTLGKHWIKTVFPVVLDRWKNNKSTNESKFTSIMQWKSYADVEYQGKLFGNKEMSFPAYFDLPGLTPHPLMLAFTGDYKIESKLRDKGWIMVSGWANTLTAESYRRFIQSSKAEFSIAKHGYVEMRSGWFSDRSTCYLASGRPIVVQNTGQKDWLPVGDGVLSFSGVAEAVKCIQTVNDDYEHHCSAATQVAEHYFDANKVLPILLEEAMA